MNTNNMPPMSLVSISSLGSPPQKRPSFCRRASLVDRIPTKVGLPWRGASLELAYPRDGCARDCLSSPLLPKGLGRMALFPERQRWGMVIFTIITHLFARFQGPNLK